MLRDGAFKGQRDLMCTPMVGRMTHVLLCREYPPSPYPAGGIGTYSLHIATLLAEAGETVHVIAQIWDGAPQALCSTCEGRLLVHRISLELPIADGPACKMGEKEILRGLAFSTCPTQLFAWQAARYVEGLIETEAVDLIEAPEWEACLYYLTVRRALGLGPARKPPCVVHLHSPTKMIAEQNEWDMTLTDFGPLCRMEEYTIRSADALICPSRYLAEGVAEGYGIGQWRIEVIPYPMGKTSLMERAPESWASDAICYVGRLELRKGVIEWVDAAVQVATSHASVSFDFFGSDTSMGGGFGASVLETLEARIPVKLRPRFRFHGGQSRETLLLHLAKVAIAVVPSRWENLPFTCIEAMATGLPLIVSPNGGMVELVRDGESGWVALDGSVEGLASALVRALASPPATREAMGRAAANSVRAHCALEVVLPRQLAFRQKVVAEGATRSLRVRGDLDARQTEQPSCRGMGVVVTCLEQPWNLSGCLQRIAAQSTLVPTVVVISEHLRASVQKLMRDTMGGQKQSLQFTFARDLSLNEAIKVGLFSLRERAPELRSVAVLDQNARLSPGYAAGCESVFEMQPGVGLVSPWLTRGSKLGELDPGPCAAPSRTEDGRNLPRYAAVRLAAIPTTYDGSFLHFLAGGEWSAVTYPGPTVSVHSPRQAGRAWGPPRRYSGMALIQSGTVRFALMWFMEAPWREKVRWLGHIAGKRRRVVRWLWWRLRGNALNPL